MGLRTGALEAVEMMGTAVPSPAFWRGKRVLLTGHSGFKGGWLTLWLHALGADVTGLGLPPDTTPNLFTAALIDTVCRSRFCDIRDSATTREVVRDANPDIVFHLAAQPLVRTSYRYPVETFGTNVMGTVHVLQALRELPSVRAAVMVTTDKVYATREWMWPYREDDALGGRDPYSASKAAAEMVVGAFRESFLAAQGVGVATARSGNVIGGGDWAEDRLIPDAVRAWHDGRALELRQPNAVRPWQHVLDPLAGYLALAQALCEGRCTAGAFNFGPDTRESATVGQVAEMARAAFGKGEIILTELGPQPHETGLLTLEPAKARAVLGVASRFDLVQAIERTMRWYREAASGGDARRLCLDDIAEWECAR